MDKELKGILEERNRLLREQNNILKAGIITLGAELSAHTYFMSIASGEEADRFQKLMDGCEAYAERALNRSLQSASEIPFDEHGVPLQSD